LQQLGLYETLAHGSGRAGRIEKLREGPGIIMTSYSSERSNNYSKGFKKPL